MEEKQLEWSCLSWLLLVVRNSYRELYIKEFLVKNPEFTAELVKMTAEEASKTLKAKGFDVDSETMKILLEDIKKRVSDCSLTMGGGCLM